MKTIAVVVVLVACTKAEPEAHKPNPADGIGAPKYAVCVGQTENTSQRAPSYLDTMADCASSDPAASVKLSERGGDGAIAGKDCKFAGGISCHFHTAKEFVSTAAPADDPGVGELHCIVPSADANSPTVYGAHIRCKPGTTAAAGTKACSRELLGIVETPSCHTGWKCCDNGTLTNVIGAQSDDQRKVRPDFRVCQDAAIEIDCGLLHEMHGHTANVLGKEFTGTFGAEK